MPGWIMSSAPNINIIETKPEKMMCPSSTSDSEATEQKIPAKNGVPALTCP